MDWVDEEFMIKNETKTADFDSLPEGVREEVNPDTVYACAEEQMALMLENPEMVAQMEVNCTKKLYLIYLQSIHILSFFSFLIF